MKNYLNGNLFYNRAKIIKDDYNYKYIVLVESKKDEKFYNHLFSNDVYILPLSGWENVLQTIIFANSICAKFILGIIDRDYHLLLNDGIIDTPNLLLTDENDIEMMLFYSSAFDRFLSIIGSKEKLEAYNDCRKVIIGTASKIGLIRFLSLKNSYNLYFDNFELKTVVDKETLTIDVNKLVVKVLARTRSARKPVAIGLEAIISAFDDNYCKYQPQCLCNGHDVCDIICIALQKCFGTVNANEYTAEDVFTHLLMGYSFESFQNMPMYKKYVGWSQEHSC